MSDQTERIIEALTPYGINTTEEFWRRYHTDALIHALVTIVVGQAEGTKEAVKEALMKGVEVGAEKAMAHLKERLGQVL